MIRAMQRYDVGVMELRGIRGGRREQELDAGVPL